MKFCDKLQKIRKENNITQEGLADKLNVTRQAVSKWESGTAYPDTEKLIQISKMFKVSLDDLINDETEINKVDNEKKFNFMETFNMVSEFVSKVFKMFWSMTFGEKCKFLIEMILVVLFIWGVSAILNAIIIGIVRRIFSFMPYNIMHAITDIADTILYVVWLVLGSVIFIKVLKSRYLDYYIIIEDDSVSEKVVEEPIKELKEKKEYKVVIRDPEHSNFNILKKIGSVILFFFKLFCIFIALPIVVSFITFVALFVISLVFIFSGLFFNGISLGLLGVIIFTFLLLEFMYNIVFNRKNSYLRMFIMFIISLSLIGTGIGLSFVSLDSFTTYNEVSTNDKMVTKTIPMRDNLVLEDISYFHDGSNVVIDDSLDDIKVDFAIKEDANVDYYTIGHYDNEKIYEIVYFDQYYDNFKVLKRITSDLKKKRINVADFNSSDMDYTIYISSDNFDILAKNYSEIYD